MRLKLLALLLMLAGPALAFDLGRPAHYMSAASTNSTLVQGKATLVTSVVLANGTATAYYLKLYNKATAPTCGTDLPVTTITLPANGSVNVPFAPGAYFSLGLGFCLTGAIADADATNAATGVSINLVYN